VDRCDGGNCQAQIVAICRCESSVRFLALLQRSGSGRLERLTFSESNGKHWYEIYLTMFVLLSSLEIVHARQVEILQRFEEKVSVYPQIDCGRVFMKQLWRGL
jgi:hypothetical protein